MIQRIQTIFLLITAILMAVTVFSPLASVKSTEAGNVFILLTCGIESASPAFKTWGVFTFAVLGVLIPLINIFLYKRRKLQMKMGTLTSLIIIMFYITFYVYLNSLTANHPFVYDNLQYGIIFPLIALIFNILSILRIKKDEKLIQSLNRIR